jgi:hypothetical protein
LTGSVGVDTFGYDRYINQILYNSEEWKIIRRKVIIRDGGCDLGIKGYDIYDEILVHHIVPITLSDIENGNPIVFDLNNLICTTRYTHNLIHYGKADSLRRLIPMERSPNDTCPWKK